MPLPPLLRAAVFLSKPGIIRGNLVTASAGYLLASGSHVELNKFVATLAGLTLIIASGCILNNVIDQKIDQKMERTKKRRAALDALTVRGSLFTALVILGLGTLLLFYYAGPFAAGAAVLGFFVYVVPYSLIAKTKTAHAALVGSISGAIPPVVGYTAVSESLDKAGVILFLILIFWQMPHFYAIALYRLKEYRSAGIPVLPLVKSHQIVKNYILFFIVLYSIASLSLYFYDFTGIVYLIVMTLLCILWLIKGIRGYNEQDTNLWSKDMFRISLIIISIQSVLIAANQLLLQMV